MTKTKKTPGKASDGASDVVMSDDMTTRQEGGVPGETLSDPPPGGPDDKKTRQDKTKPSIKLPILISAGSVVIAGAALALHAYGWWAVAVIVVTLGFVGYWSFQLWNGKGKRGSRRGMSRSGHGPGSSRGGRKGFFSSRNPFGKKGQGKGHNAGRGTPKGSGTSRNSSPGGRSKGLFGKSRKGRGTKGGTKSGMFSGGTSRGGRGSGSRGASGGGRGGRGSSRGGRNPWWKPWGRNKHGLLSGMYSGAVGTANAIKKADKKIGDALTEAVDTVWPLQVDAVLEEETEETTEDNSNEQDTQTIGVIGMNGRSKVAEYTNGLSMIPTVDEILEHDLGVQTLVEDMANMFIEIAQMVTKYTEMVHANNDVGNETVVISAFGKVTEVSKASAETCEELYKVLRNSQTWQDMEERLARKNGEKSDVSRAKNMGYL